MFEGFTEDRIVTSGAEINLRVGGSGPPLLLLHGYPQSHVMWHGLAPRLAERFTVVCSDLRGYGDSSKPPGGGDHATYSKRAMARDQVEVMEELGFRRFAVAGHDRGGRVGHRMALDFPASGLGPGLKTPPGRSVETLLSCANPRRSWRPFLLFLTLQRIFSGCLLHVS